MNQRSKELYKCGFNSVGAVDVTVDPLGVWVFAPTLFLLFASQCKIYIKK